MGFAASESWRSIERSCQSIPVGPALHPSSSLLFAHTQRQLVVYINRPGRLESHTDFLRNSWGTRKDARVASWIWKLLLREEPRNAGWISDPGPGVSIGCTAAAATTTGSASGSYGSRSSHNILRTAGIQLCPLSTPQAHHAHGELNFHKIFS